ncbi:glycerophosphodiester phosphodiesterase [uncultured Clostridium sp.]|uniref:glycerophosphodiester phosphodiesterase n=1 Tax=uncultured Clostridium sp. TaxID=59620 RepID=UPI002625FEF4|nr:glycerophosphodiester phosphodiesterase [uncultured Clostridium sp.]
MKKVLNLAHRGYSEKYPENTMLAFKKAIEIGADGIEMDVHFSKDGQLVIIHDEELDRTTTGHGYVKDYTLEELRGFDAGIKFGEEFKGLKIPTFDEFLELIKDKNLLINIEIKNSIIHYENIEEAVYAKIKEFGIENKVIISTFDHYSAKKCKGLNGDIKVGALYWDCIYEPYNYVEMLGVDALHPEFNSITKEIVEESHKRKLQVNVYTVNLKEDMEKMISLGVDMIITNDPKLLKEALQNK